jgi:hypothetical protein
VEVENTRLSDIIKRNTNVGDELRDNAFVFPKGDVDGLGDGTKLSDIILTIDFFLERKTPTNEQLLVADVEPHTDGQQRCGDGQIKLGDITTLIDMFLERETIAHVCG